MMLARNVSERVIVTATIGDHYEDRIFPIFRIRLHRRDQLLQSIVHNCDGAGVVSYVSPVHVITVLVIDHEQFWPQLRNSPNGQLSQQTITARIDQSALAIILPPAFPELH